MELVAINLREFQHRLAQQRCWIDGARTHHSFAGQRQCPQCRRKWSFSNLQRHWRLAKLFCAPSDRKFECDREAFSSPDNFGPGHEFTVSHPARQVIDRIHAAVLLECGDRVAGRTIARARKIAINARAVGRIYTTFEFLMLLEYFFDAKDAQRPSRAELLKLARMKAAPSAADDEHAVQDALQTIAKAQPEKFREILDWTLKSIWKDEAGLGGYAGRLEILYRRFFAAKLDQLKVNPYGWSRFRRRMHPYVRSAPLTWQFSRSATKTCAR